MIELLSPGHLFTFSLGVLASLLAAAIATSLRRIKFFLQSTVSSRRVIRNFIARDLKHFKRAYPSWLSKRLDDPRYYYREEGDFEGRQSAVFLFFTREGIQIQQFKGMLIPALDLGHGSLFYKSANDGSLGMRFDEKWEKYLIGIGRKIAAAASRQTTAQLTNGLQKAETPEAKRIILIDKRMLNIFIFRKEWILSTLSEYKHQDEGLRLLSSLAMGIVKYAKQVAEVHRLARTFHGHIESRYIDKSMVASDEYYDFGLYRINGIPIVYNPIYEKRRAKRIVREKIYVGVSRRQLFDINEYERDFDLLWERVENTCIRQDDHLRDDNPESYFRVLDGEYFREFDSYSFDFFHAGYYSLINDLLKDDFKDY